MLKSILENQEVAYELNEWYAYCRNQELFSQQLRNIKTFLIAKLKDQNIVGEILEFTD